MNNSKNNQLNWFTSKEARKKLKVSGCKLMHLRESGKLKFKKVGNAYYYLIEKSDEELNP